MRNISVRSLAFVGLLVAFPVFAKDRSFDRLYSIQPDPPPEAYRGMVSPSKVLASIRSAAGEGDENAKYCLTVLETGHPDGPTDLKPFADSQDIFELNNDATCGGTLSQYEYGMRYLLGIGFARDEAAAGEWFRRAAEEGNGLAEFTLGRLYEDGRGVDRDNARALACYRQAAGLGNFPAQIFLSEIYGQGLLGARKDPAEAAAWLSRIAERRRAIEKAQATPEGLVEPGKPDPALLRAAAECGDTDAQFQLGHYEGGYFGQQVKDAAQGRAWYLKAAAQGNAEAMAELGRSGSDAEEFAWLLKAAQHGHAEAQWTIGANYEDGEDGQEKDGRLALLWLTRSAELGNSEAEFRLGSFYREGNHVKKDLAQAAFWYRKAALQWNSDAQTALDHLRAELADLPPDALEPDGSLNPGIREALEWFATLGLPSIKHLPPVKVWTGGVAISEGQKSSVIALGFLRKSEGKELTILTPALVEKEFADLGQPAGSGEIVRYERISLDDLVAPFLKSSGFGSGDSFDGPSPSPPAQLFILAFCCQQQGREDLAEKLLVQMAPDLRRYQPGNREPVPLKQSIVNVLADYFFQRALLDFGDARLTRPQLKERLLIFISHFPYTKPAAQAQVLVTGLESLITAEKAHPSGDTGDLSALPPAERASAWVARLPDQRGELGGAVDQLTKLGADAVPALLDAVDDNRPTRAVIYFCREMQGNVRLFSVGELAARSLGEISGKQFQFCAPSAFTPAPVRPSALRETYQQWWNEYQSKGEREYLVDEVASGGPDAANLARRIFLRYPDSAGEAIGRGFPKMPSFQQINLLNAQLALHDPAWIALLRRELQTGPTLGHKVAAAFSLRALGESGANEAMLAEWKNLFGQPHGDGVSDLIRFLSSSGDKEVIVSLTADLRQRPVWARVEVIEDLGQAYAKNIWNGGQPASPEMQAFIAVALVACLDDDEDQWGASYASLRDPSVGDMAAWQLSRLLPGQYHFDPGASRADKDAARLAMQNQWRKAASLPPMSSPSLPVVSESGRNVVTEITFADDALKGTALRREIEKLKGSPLSADALAGLLCAFGLQPPEGFTGLRFRAYRSPAPHGIFLKVLTSGGPDFTSGQDFRWFTEIGLDQKKISLPLCGTRSRQDAGQAGSWREFTSALTKALAEPPDTELIVRAGLWLNH